MGQLQTRGDDDGEDIGELPGLSITGFEELEGGEDELVYELEDWADGDRKALRERIELLGVPHRWEGAALVIAASDEAWLERILDQVEDDLSLQLDADAEQVAYDLGSWEEAQREALFDALADEAIPHGVEGDELFVHEIDEQRVDELIDGVLDPERAAPASEGGQAVMGELFVAADRLRRDAHDHEGTLSLHDAARMAASSPAPYGMDHRWWNETVDAANALAALVEDDASDENTVMEAADALRVRLRPYV